MKWYDEYFLCEPEIFLPMQEKSGTKIQEIMKPKVMHISEVHSIQRLIFLPLPCLDPYMDFCQNLPT